MRQRKRHGLRLAHLLRRVVVRVVSTLLGCLPPRMVVEIRELLEPYGLLDYDAKEVRLQFDSVAAYHRSGSCRKEPETVHWIESHFQRGSVLYDIGANVGAYSLVALAATNGDCRVVAFEPSFTTFANLCSNLQLNGFEQSAIPIQLALSDQTRLETFRYSRTDAGSALHHLGDEVNGFQAELNQTVPAFRLDELMPTLDLPRPNLVKIDVDGSELAVLRGAGDLLADSNLWSVMVEVDEDADPNGHILRHLESYGFRLASRHPRGFSGKLFNLCFVRSREGD